MSIFTIQYDNQKTQVYGGENAFANYALKSVKGRAFVVTDKNVYAIYGQLIKSTYGDDVYVLRVGEASKSTTTLIKILTTLHEKGIGKYDTIIAFGGGVVGDVTGLAASLYMRGINYVYVPTTLLAQVDSCVGGKTAINLCGVKNLVGSFYQPSAIIIDTMFLRTLKEKHIRCGLGEIVKTAALDKDILNYVLKNLYFLSDYDCLEQLIPMCIKFKALIVSKDEKERSGLRKCLNLGHTTGHVLEAHYAVYSHGEYVLVGMFLELYIAQKLGICQETYASALYKIIKKVLVYMPALSNLRSVLRLALSDKKNTAPNEVCLILPKSEGEYVQVNLSYSDYEEYVIEAYESSDKRF